MWHLYWYHRPHYTGNNFSNTSNGKWVFELATNSIQRYKVAKSGGESRLWQIVRTALHSKSSVLFRLQDGAVPSRFECSSEMSGWVQLQHWQAGLCIVGKTEQPCQAYFPAIETSWIQKHTYICLQMIYLIWFTCRYTTSVHLEKISGQQICSFYEHSLDKYPLW